MARVGEVDMTMWSPIIDSWASVPSMDSKIDQPSCWSPSELAVAAALRGTADFPTVGVAWLAGLPSSSVDAVIDTVTRSFIARGLLVPGEAGGAELAGGLRSVVDTALLAEIVIGVAHLTGEGTQHTWLGATVDGAERIVLTDVGARRIDHFAPTDLAAAVLAAVGDDGELADAHLEPPHCRITSSMVADSSSDLMSLTRITTTWRLDGRIHGGVFYWARYATRTGWLAEPVGEEWTLHRSEGFRAVLLAHLPQSTD